MAFLYLSGRWRVNASFVSYRWLSASKTGKSQVLAMPIGYCSYNGHVNASAIGTGIVGPGWRLGLLRQLTFTSEEPGCMEVATMQPEPAPSVARVRHGDRVVAESTRTVRVDQPDVAPVLWFPASDCSGDVDGL